MLTKTLVGPEARTPAGEMDPANTTAIKKHQTHQAVFTEHGKGKTTFRIDLEKPVTTDPIQGLRIPGSDFGIFKSPDGINAPQVK